MNIREIEILLEKYYEGQTTLREEQILQTFFCSDEVPDNLKVHQPLFRYTELTKLDTLADPDFEQKLNARLTTEIKATPLMHSTSLMKNFLFIGSIAAGILLLLGIFFTLQHDIFRKSSTDALISPQEQAYAEARQALLIVSANFNTGIKQVERIQLIDKAMKDAELLNKFYQYQTIIINPDDDQKQSIKSKQP
ncbi:MAG: hypothetical protein M0Q38_08340 [Bacteroidales bacterium]|jgi:hypothetical protein|nr:hypothetical protein [Bacteroidales bacterium]